MNTKPILSFLIKRFEYMRYLIPYFKQRYPSDLRTIINKTGKVPKHLSIRDATRTSCLNELKQKDSRLL